MNKSIILHELKMMVRSKKNILFIISILALILSYCFIILPSKQTIDSFFPNEERKLVEEISAIQTGKKSRGETGFSPMSGRFIYAENEFQLQLRNRLLQSFEDENYTRFTYLRLLDFKENKIALDKETWLKSPFPIKDSYHLEFQTILRYQGYLESGKPVTYELLEQKTALQTIQNFILSSAVLGIFFCAIYFSCDMLTRDHQNRTLLQGLPLSWYQFINMKSVVAFLYTTGILVGLLLITTLILTIQNGFGSFSIRIPIHIPEASGVFSMNYYETISLAKFLAIAAGFLLILVFLFIRLNALLSLFVKNTWIVLMVSTSFLFIEKLYFARTLRHLGGIEISHFPQTYFEVGKVITGEMNFLVNLQSITIEKGFLILIMTLFVVEISLFITARIINKRRFFQNA